MSDLSKARTRDVMVASYFAMWSHGEFATFEQMLIALCVALWEKKSVYEAQIVWAIERGKINPHFVDQFNKRSEQENKQ